jgi:alpha-L-arabinofuranosidase
MNNEEQIEDKESEKSREEKETKSKSKRTRSSLRAFVQQSFSSYSNEEMQLWRSIQLHLLSFHKIFVEYLLLKQYQTRNSSQKQKGTNENDIKQMALSYLEAIRRYKDCKLAFELNQVSQMIHWLHLKEQQISDARSEWNRWELLEKVWLYEQMDFGNKRPLYLATLSKVRKEAEQV